MNEQVIDRETFETLKAMTDAGFLQELIDVFLSDSPDQIAEMHAALEEGNAERLRRAAHSLKSNSASFGAMRLSALSREVEFLARDGALKPAVPKVEELEAEYSQVAVALSEISNG